MLLIKNRSFLLVLLTVLLVSGCGKSKLPPVERIVTQTKLVQTVPNPGNLPDEVSRREFAEFEIITQSNIHSIIEAVEAGERAPLNHVAIEYTYYLELAAWMAALQKYIDQADPMLKRWQSLYFKSLEQK